MLQCSFFCILTDVAFASQCGLHSERLDCRRQPNRSTSAAAAALRRNAHTVDALISQVYHSCTDPLVDQCTLTGDDPTQLSDSAAALFLVT